MIVVGLRLRLVICLVLGSYEAICIASFVTLKKFARDELTLWLVECDELPSPHLFVNL